MWMCVWLAISISTGTVFTQQTLTSVNHNGASFEWGWQLTPPGESPGTLGHYIVKLPQAEQRVVYAADGSGYHGAVAVNTSDETHTHTAQFALGEKALQLNAQQIQPLYPQNLDPVEIYLLQQQYQPYQPAQPSEPFFLQASSTNHGYNQLTPIYNYHTQHQNTRSSTSKPLHVHLDKIQGTTQSFSIPSDSRISSSKPVSSNLDKSQPTLQTFSSHSDTRKSKNTQSFTSHKDTNERAPSPTSIVQVFKDHNCSDTETEKEVDLSKSKPLLAEVPSYNVKNINGNFGVKARVINSKSHKGTVNSKVETTRQNARTEKVLQKAHAPSKVTHYDKGIQRLVEFTQDLISNDDLFRINHAAEESLKEHGEDLIKPKPRFAFRSNSNNYETLRASPTQITVKSKISNIVNSDLEHLENDTNKESILQSNADEFRFAYPIVVADYPKNENQQLYNNIVSTMTPYLENGYEVIGIKPYEHNNFNADANATPRPVSQNYLAPITVAIRLLNHNFNATNSLEDHEFSDSEIVPKTINPANPQGKTVVEIQQSIPLDITHINAVEVHEYMDEGRSNNNKNPIETVRNLYNKYVNAIKSKRKLSDNINKLIKEYEDDREGSEKRKDQNENSADSGEIDSENVPSESIRSEVNVNNEDPGQKRSEFYLNPEDIDYESQRIIQPIIVEKQVPVTQFVDRYIEKPYSDPITLPVPIDRPVPVPIEVEKYIEKPYEVTKYIDKPYPVEVPRPYPVEIKVPYPVEQKVYVDRPVHVPYPVDRIIEKQIVHQVPVPTPVAVPVEVQVPVEKQVLYPVEVEKQIPVRVEVPTPVERIVHRDVPVPYPVEKRVPYPVPYETKVPVPYAVEKRVPVPHPVPVPVHVHHPYPVDRIVEKKVPYPVHVEKIVEKKVPYNVPYPVEKIVEKIVEKPVVITKYIDKPYPVEKRVPYPVEKIIEKKVPYAVHVPVHVKVPYPVEKIVEKPVHIPVLYRYKYTKHKLLGQDTQNVYEIVDPQQKLQENLYQENKYLENRYPENKYPENKYLENKYPENKYQLNHINQDAIRPLVQASSWNNRYAQSYQYINSDTSRETIKPKYSQYHSPSFQNRNNYAETKNYAQNQRQPKVINIEYGGFKPPLIPSTEIDLDGNPVQKAEE